jgi:hypothetical protein
LACRNDLPGQFGSAKSKFAATTAPPAIQISRAMEIDETPAVRKKKCDVRLVSYSHLSLT